MIHVRLMHREGRKHLEARWIDPLTGKLKTKSTGTSKRKDAERFAARLEDQLNAAPDRANVTEARFADIWERYKSEVFPELSRKTCQKTTSAINSFQEMVNPLFVASITANVLQSWSASLRRKELAGYTIKGYLAEVSKVLRWADRVGIAGKPPHVEMPRRLASMKGRAPTSEEFDRMRVAAAEVIPAGQLESWLQLLDGLWLSGLRLDEAMRLRWDVDSNFAVDLSGRYPMFRIQASGQKARRFELAPMTADFAEFLLKTPAEMRRGFVFDPLSFMEPHIRLQTDWVGKIISRIGESALVQVGNGKAASAHDLRRAFGSRWAVRVMPAVLQSLMRHKSIATTMQFYVGHNAQANAEAAWMAISGNKTGNTDTHSPKSNPDSKHETA
jgi:integrase